MRYTLPAKECDVLSCVFYPSLEGYISIYALHQIVSAVSRYHELHYLPSPARTHLIRQLKKGYHSSYDDNNPVRAICVGFTSSAIRNIMYFGLVPTKPVDIEHCVVTIFPFISQALSFSVQHLHLNDHHTFDDGIRIKVKSISLPFLLRYS